MDVDPPLRRIVLLGASNLALTFPAIVETAHRAWGAPLEFFVAMGFGRSFGSESGCFGKKNTNIFSADFCSAIESAQRLATSAIVADVGNDLAYGATPEEVVGWVDEVLVRLTAQGARTALANVPIASLRGLGEVRYRIMKSVLFPRCDLSRDEMLRRAEALFAGLAATAERRKVPVFTGENAWYGVDPIHPRRSCAALPWRQLLAATADEGEVVSVERVSWRRSVELRRLAARPTQRASSHRGKEDRVIRDRRGSFFRFF